MPNLLTPIQYPTAGFVLSGIGWLFIFGCPLIGVGVMAFRWRAGRSGLLVFAVLVLLLFTTLVAFHYAQNIALRRAERRFAHELDIIEARIRHRVETYLTALSGFQSLFGTMENLPEQVSRDSFLEFAENFGLTGKSSAIHSVSYAERVLPGENTAPETEHYVISDIYPRAEYMGEHGIDLFSDLIRREAIERARDTGVPIATRRSVQTMKDGESRRVFELFLPVYSSEAPLTTTEARRAAIGGVLRFVVGVDTFLSNVLDDVLNHPDIDVQIFDNNLPIAIAVENRPLSLQPVQPGHKPRFTATVDVESARQIWTFAFSTRPGSEMEAVDNDLPMVVLMAGLMLSGLLAGITYFLASSQSRAEQIAQRVRRQLDAQNAQVVRSDRLRSLGEMAAGIAHELNQPLVGVRGLAEHILIGIEQGWDMDNEGISEKLEMIIEQADRMTHIIEHVRIFSREAGKPTLSRVNLNDVVQSGIDLLGTQFRSHGLMLETELADALPEVLANPFSLEEVVLNLMTNARDAVEERLETEPDLDTPKVLLRTRKIEKDGRAFVEIEVADSGVGIPEAIQSKIFDPFFTTKPPDKGTGLGLAISQSIVESFNGTLRLETLEPNGTRAIITIPACQ